MDSYQKTVGNTVKSLLNRRAVHLKKAIGSKDPFGNTVKAVYKKAEKQLKGPLYDKNNSSKYKNETKIDVQSNESDEELKEIDDLEERNDLNSANNKQELRHKLKTPNYKLIAQKVKLRQSSQKK